MKTYSQNKKIKEHLLKGYSITPIEALNMFGCFRLSARIHDLKKDIDITADKVIHNGKTFCNYYIKR